MLWFRWVCVGLLVSVSTTGAFAQSGDGLQPGSGPRVEFQQPLPGEPAAATVPTSAVPTSAVPTSAVPTSAVPTSAVPLIETPSLHPLDEFLGYRYDTSSLGWMIGGGDQFGMLSLEWDHYQKPGENTGIGLGLKIHFLDGPVRTEMPPRLFDFSAAFQSRKRLGDFSYDVAASVMASSDFEGSAREGIRFPSHAVGFLHLGPTIELVFGADYLDRRDFPLLPVAGLILLPHPDLRFEIIFPRPRVVIRLTDTHRLFVRGELGGGTWDIERADIFDDVATYGDLRVSIGLECIDESGLRSALEIGYLFDRHLQYTTGIGDYHLDDTAMLRLSHTF